MDNNLAEQAVRPFSLGRKNCVCVNSIHGAEASAILYSIVETVNANGLKVYDCLEFLLTELPKRDENTDRDFLEALLPWSKTVQEKCSNLKNLIHLSRCKSIKSPVKWRFLFVLVRMVDNLPF